MQPAAFVSPLRFSYLTFVQGSSEGGMPEGCFISRTLFFKEWMTSRHTTLQHITVHISIYIKEEGVIPPSCPSSHTLFMAFSVFTLPLLTINLSVTLSGSWAFVPARLTFSRDIYEVFVLIYHNMTRPPWQSKSVLYFNGISRWYTAVIYFYL